jgi:alkylation response protein AidB-like acyl-CoA dehydrogenase
VATTPTADGTPRSTAIDPVAVARELAARFAAGAAERDRTNAFPHDEIRELRASGLLPLIVPAEHGGLDADTLTVTRVVSTLAEGDPSIAQMYLIHTLEILVLRNALIDEAARDELYRNVVDGSLFFTNAWSEKGGKNALEFGVALRRDPAGGWRIDGRKFYSTGSLAGDLILSAGVTDEDEPRVLTALVPADAPGVRIHDDWDGFGQRTTASGTVTFEDVPLPDALVFDVPSVTQPDNPFGSFSQIMFTSVLVGIARNALAEAVAFVDARARPWIHSGVERAADDPHVQALVGRMRVQVSAAGAMLERAALIREPAAQEPSPAARDAASVAVAEAKVVATETALRVSETAIQVGGASAALAKHGLDRHWRNARTISLHDPVHYKLVLIGDAELNGTSPPISVYT